MHPATKLDADYFGRPVFAMTRKIKLPSIYIFFFKYQEGVLDLTGSTITHFFKK